MARTNIRGTQIADGPTGVDLAVDVTGLLPVGNGGTGVANPTAGRFLVGNGTSVVDLSKLVPTGAVVGDTDTQTLTNKTLTLPKITQSATPSAPAAGVDTVYTKSDDNVYMMANDGVERQIRVVHPVRVAATSVITPLSGIPANTLTDGVTLVAGDRILLHLQGTFVGGNAYDNGIWVIAAGAWSRAADANSAADMAGMEVIATEGTNYNGTLFKTNFKATDTLGTTACKWYGQGSKVDIGGPFNIPFQAGLGHMYFDGANRLFQIWNGVSWDKPKGIPDYTSTPPANPVTGELWYDSSVNLLKVYNGTAFVPTGISDAMPIGTVFAFAGVSAPTGCLVADGSSQLRATYPDLLAATTFQAIGSGAAAQAVVTTSDTSNMRVGMRVEQANITGGAATILSINPNVSFTLSANLSTLTTSQNFTFFPHGAVDSTHFNIPLATGRVTVGKDGTTEFATVGQTGGDKLLQAHSHTEGSHTHTIPGVAFASNTTATGSGIRITDIGNLSGGTGTGITPTTNASNGAGTGSAGGGASQNLQPYTTLLHVVKATAASVNVALPYQSAAPTSPQVGVQWYDSTYGIHKMWNGSAWDPIGYGPTLKKRTTISANSAAVSAETVLATLASITVDGATEVEVVFTWYNFTHTVTTDSFVCLLYDGPTAGSGTLLGEWLHILAANGGSGSLRWRGTPSAGAHTYTARVSRASGTGTATLIATATIPAILTVNPV